jgi:hypothetical protein
MSVQIITPEDLQNFKTDLLAEIRNIIAGQQSQSAKQWLKSTEVRRMLAISPGTLQTLRLNGTLPYTKIGGTIYYSTADIENILSKNQKQHKSSLLFP